MRKMISAVDAVLDMLGDDEDPNHALADLLDKHGAWDWDDGAEHDPSDRVAVVESTGAWWAVYRGTEGDEAIRCATDEEAREAANEWVSAIKPGETV